MFCLSCRLACTSSLAALHLSVLLSFLLDCYHYYCYYCCFSSTIVYRRLPAHWGALVSGSRPFPLGARQPASLRLSLPRSQHLISWFLVLVQLLHAHRTLPVWHCTRPHAHFHSLLLRSPQYLRAEPAYHRSSAHPRLRRAAHYKEIKPERRTRVVGSVGQHTRDHGAHTHDDDDAEG